MNATGALTTGTSSRMRAVLEVLGFGIISVGDSGAVAAILRGAFPGPAVLLDAEGIELDVAQALAARRAELHGTALLRLRGNRSALLAKAVRAAADLQVVAAYSVRSVPDEPGGAGENTTRPGPVVAGLIGLGVFVNGTSGPVVEPHLVRNPIPPVAAMVGSLRAFVTRRFSVFDPVVLTVTVIEAHSPRAVPVADEASIRVHSAESLDRVVFELPSHVQAIANAADGGAHVKIDVEVHQYGHISADSDDSEPRHNYSSVLLFDQRTGRIAAGIEVGTANAYRTAAADALAVHASAILRRRGTPLAGKQG